LLKPNLALRQLRDSFVEQSKREKQQPQKEHGQQLQLQEQQEQQLEKNQQLQVHEKQEQQQQQQHEQQLHEKQQLQLHGQQQQDEKNIHHHELQLQEKQQLQQHDQQLQEKQYLLPQNEPLLQEKQQLQEQQQQLLPHDQDQQLREKQQKQLQQHEEKQQPPEQVPVLLQLCQEEQLHHQLGISLEEDSLGDDRSSRNVCSIGEEMAAENSLQQNLDDVSVDSQPITDNKNTDNSSGQDLDKVLELINVCSSSDEDAGDKMSCPKKMTTAHEKIFKSCTGIVSTAYDPPSSSNRVRGPATSESGIKVNNLNVDAPEHIGNEHHYRTSGQTPSLISRTTRERLTAIWNKAQWLTSIQGKDMYTFGLTLMFFLFHLHAVSFFACKSYCCCQQK
jgi:hypothetical protein